MRTISAGALQLLGRPERDVSGRPFADLLHPEERGRWAAAVAAGTGEARSLCLNVRTAEGQVRRIALEAGPSGPDGLVLAVLSRVAEAARLSPLGAEVEQVSGVGCWEIRLESGDVYWSPVTRAIHGIEPGEDCPTLEQALAYYPGEARERIAAAVAGLVERGEGYDLELPFVTAHGRRIIVRTTGAAEMRDGRVVRASGTFRDVTESREAEARLVAAEAEARAARERLMSAVEALPDGFTYYDRHERLMLCNERYREFYPETAPVLAPGVGFEEMLRYGVARGQYLDAIGREEEWIAERLALHRQPQSAMEQQLPGGRWIRVVEKATPDGGRVGLRIDISAMKAQQAELAATNERLRSALAERDAAESRFFDIAEVSTDWFWEQDAEMRFTFISRSFERTAGGRCEDHIGKTRAELFANHPEVWESADWAWLDARIAAREPFSDFVYRAKGTTPHSIWVRISGAPFHDKDGRFAGYRGVGSDVSLLYSALKRAEEANRAKSQFLASMSHEIRTPMNGVLGMAEVLDATLSEPAQRRMIAAIRESGETLLNVIDDILDFSKIEAGRLELEQVDFRPEDLARRVESLHTLKAAEKRISLAVLTTRGAELYRRGDQHRILQILHNLVSNAIKFTQEGEVVVTLRCHRERPMVIEVRDTGIGMTEEQIARVFDDFAQADSSTTRRFGGTGLGMAIVRRLIEAMEGTIEVASRPGEGTCVRVALPLEVIDRPLPRDETSAAEPLPPGLRILAADDNRTNRLVLEAMLARLGVAAEIVAGGAEAVEAAASRRYDLLLLDISMPDMDGIEALAAIRAGEDAAGLPFVPAIAVTANALTHQVESYLARGFAAHVPKPLRADVLLDAMMRCLDAAEPAGAPSEAAVP